MNNKLKVIVIAWNRLEFTKRTIASLMRTVPESKIYIHDNCSTEAGMYEYYNTLKDAYVTISDKNEGWGKAVNESLEGIDSWNADYILLANNDVEFHDGWYDKAIELYEKYPKIGILGLWKSPNHGVQEDHGDLVKKDQMPAVAWLFKPSVLKDLGEIKENGPCLTKGGNGEDVDYCIRAEQKGYWVAGPVPDLADHLDP